MWDVHLYRLKFFPGHAKAICQNQYIYLDRRLESEKQIKCQQATQNVFSIGRHLTEQPNIVKVTQIPRPIPIPSHANPSPGLLLLPLPVWFWPNRFTLCCRQPFSQPGCKYVQRLNVSNKARRRRTRGGGLGLGLARAEPLMDKSLRTQLVISGHKQLSDSYRAKRDFGIE